MEKIVSHFHFYTWLIQDIKKYRYPPRYQLLNSLTILIIRPYSFIVHYRQVKYSWEQLGDTSSVPTQQTPLKFVDSYSFCIDILGISKNITSNNTHNLGYKFIDQSEISSNKDSYIFWVVPTRICNILQFSLYHLTYSSHNFRYYNLATLVTHTF